VSALACIGEPVSWLRLEMFAAGRKDLAIETHLAACPACAHCLAEITGDLVALPVLAVPARARRRWWLRLAPAFALAAAAVIALVVATRSRGHEAQREDLVSIKGVGEVVVDVVRERDGVIRQDVRSFAAGDRWKIVVTCPPSASATFELSVADGTTVDHPLAPARLACGNRVVVPGAFTITGATPNRVCVRVTPDGTNGGDAGSACVTLTPE
jgi:hypothetical protein